MIRFSFVPGTMPKLLRSAVLVAGAWCAGTAAAAQQSASPQTVEQQQIQALQNQLAAVQAQMKQLADQNQALQQKELDLERQFAQVSPSTRPSLAAQPPASAATSTVAAAANLRLWGYGELYYTRPTRDPNRAQADLARAVFGIGYSFDSRTEFNSEFEVEHAVSSASDVGEFEVEQFYVDRQLANAVTLRAGLFLMPFGLLNEHHEPTNFYGVQRNFVETLIIPSTWREAGSMSMGTPMQASAGTLGSPRDSTCRSGTTLRSFRSMRRRSIWRTATPRRCRQPSGAGSRQCA